MSAITTKRLQQLESDIELGVRSIGKALTEIHNTKAYLDGYDSFEQYCKTRWNFTDRYARNLIEAESVRTKIGTLVPVETLKTKHLLAISEVPAAKQAQVAASVIADCESENRKPTEKDFKEAAKPFVEPKKKVENKSEPKEMEYQDVPDEPKIPDALKCVPWFKDQLKLVNELKRNLDSVQELPGTELIFGRQRTILRELEHIKGGFVAAMPHSVCPRCEGAACAQCGNMGWINKQRFDELQGV